jgi:hypothetical protein
MMLELHQKGMRASGMENGYTVNDILSVLQNSKSIGGRRGLANSARVSCDEKNIPNQIS